MTRNYRLFLAGQLVSLLGTWTRIVAHSWLVYRLTGSAAWLGAIAACQQVPVVALAAFGGALADRHRRRTILLATQTAAMALSFALAALVLAGGVQLAHLIALAVVSGVVTAVDMPTRQAFVVEMVGKDALPRAVAINGAMAMTAASVGPMIAGYGLDALGAGWCFFADGASFAAVIAALIAMRDLPAPPPPRATEPVRAQLVAGFRFARGHAQVRALLGLLAITTFAGVPYSTLLPVFATRVFHGDARSLGALTAAAGLGALIGAGGLALAPRLRRPVPAAAALGVALIGFALSHHLWLSLAWLLPLGAAALLMFSATTTQLQLATPDALRGRVMAIWSMIVMALPPLGALVAGAVSAEPGPPLVVGGAICVIAALWLGRTGCATLRA